MKLNFNLSFFCFSFFQLFHQKTHHHLRERRVECVAFFSTVLFFSWTGKKRKKIAGEEDKTRDPIKYAHLFVWRLQFISSHEYLMCVLIHFRHALMTLARLLIDCLITFSCRLFFMWLMRSNFVVEFCERKNYLTLLLSNIFAMISSWRCENVFEL